MNRLAKWISSLYEPEKTNIQEGSLERIMLALNEPAVRRHWVESLIEELRNINVRFDRKMEDGIYNQFEEDMYRRRAIVFCLNQILDSKDALENQRLESERDNQTLRSPFEGVAVQRD